MAGLLAGVGVPLAIPQDVQLKESRPGLETYENSAKPGDIFSGTVIKKGKSEIYLDTTPCIADLKSKQIVGFTSPYKATKAPDLRCGDKTITGMLTVQQLKKHERSQRR